MSLFRREPETPASAASRGHQRDPALAEGKGQSLSQAITHIAPGTRVKGQITGDTEILIDGELDGDVHVGSRAVVGAEGQVVGSMQARSVRVAGKVRGNVSCLERIEILESGTLEGDLTAPRVVISEGAFFKGKVEMNEPRKTGGKVPQSSTKKKTAATSAEGRADEAEEKPEDRR